ncbi:hypothetical protein [Ulvibacterium marinum]|uniref:hypothetical protein n=1 Tax=Ulvibacterium marinum TaxID=2419782 RepID=UPI0024941545|nr:hypothetical protein [Ulvibacterium marinum]
MKASPAGYAPVYPITSLFTVPGFPRIDTSDLIETIFGTNEKSFHHMESPFHDFSIWNKG